jgi:hypothetical protein
MTGQQHPQNVEVSELADDQLAAPRIDREPSR